MVGFHLDLERFVDTIFCFPFGMSFQASLPTQQKCFFEISNPDLGSFGLLVPLSSIVRQGKWSFGLSSFCLSHSIVPFNSIFRSSKSQRGFSLLKEIHVSSARMSLQNLHSHGSKSFVYRENKRSFKHDVSGMLQATYFFECFPLK